MYQMTTDLDVRNLLRVATSSAPQWTSSVNQAPNRVIGELFVSDSDNYESEKWRINFVHVSSTNSTTTILNKKTG